MKKIIIAICLILAISLGINIWFFSGKGIEINNFTYNRQYQYQQQFQGQLLINQWTAEGNKIEWKMIEVDYDKITIELDKLHPISSLYAKVTRMPSTGVCLIYYPEIFTKTKEITK